MNGQQGRASSSYQADHIEGWIKALNAASCCSTPNPEAKTLREWEALAARSYEPLPWRIRASNRLIDAVFCSACLRLRLSPGHWLSCGGRTDKSDQQVPSASVAGGIPQHQQEYWCVGCEAWVPNEQPCHHLGRRADSAPGLQR